MVSIWLGLAVAGATDVQRMALVAGASHGGDARPVLQYAVADADAMARVLQDLAGVDPDDVIGLRDPTVDELIDGLRTLADRLEASAADRTEVVVYYSGHSDEQGLLVRDGALPYRELRAALDALPTDMRTTILDSCAAGALIRTKGGSHGGPAFLLDIPQRVTGHAILTSSAADEAAQESSALGGSFFTHYLVSGLRGAADQSGDGRVTLTEAYRFAYDETLGRTVSTLGGAQHASYGFEMQGAGDYVLTDLEQIDATLVVGPPIAGRLFIRDEGQHLVVELFKEEGRTVELGLGAGRYGITVDREGGAVPRHRDPVRWRSADPVAPAPGAPAARGHGPARRPPARGQGAAGGAVGGVGHRGGGIGDLLPHVVSVPQTGGERPVRSRDQRRDLEDQRHGGGGPGHRWVVDHLGDPGDHVVAGSSSGIDVEACYRRHGPMVLRRCRQLLRDEEQAVDATQDVFVQLLRRPSLVDRGLSSLLYRMATNVCLNRIRSRRRRPEDAASDLLERIAGASCPDQRGYARRLLEQVFGRHQPSTATMAVLFLLDGLTLEQVAAHTGLSVSGVRHRLRTLKRDVAELEDL